MTEVLDHEKEVGIDYITATTKHVHVHSDFGSFGSWLLDESVAQGATAKPWRASGYRGTQAGDRCMGSRTDGRIIRLSGQAANDYWEQLVEFSEKVTRLDLQITIGCVAGPQSTIARHYRAVKARPYANGHAFKYRCIVEKVGPTTLYLGSRSSVQFGRIYDKGLESGLPRYQGCVRYEVEVKKPLSDSLARELAFTTNVDHRINAYVREFMGAHESAIAGECPSIEIPMGVRGSINNGDSLARPDSVEQKVIWLGNQVRPTVQWLIAHGYREAALEALGIFESHFLPEQQDMDQLVH